MARIGDTPRPYVARGLFPNHHPYELTRSLLGRIAAAGVLKAEMGPVGESLTDVLVVLLPRNLGRMYVKAPFSEEWDNYLLSGPTQSAPRGLRLGRPARLRCRLVPS